MRHITIWLPLNGLITEIINITRVQLASLKNIMSTWIRLELHRWHGSNNIETRLDLLTYSTSTSSSGIPKWIVGPSPENWEKKKQKLRELHRLLNQRVKILHDRSDHIDLPPPASFHHIIWSGGDGFTQQKPEIFSSSSSANRNKIVKNLATDHKI